MKQSVGRRKRLPHHCGTGAFVCQIRLTRLAEHAQELNREYPSAQWPSAIVILDKGIIHHALRFPHSEKMANLISKRIRFRQGWRHFAVERPLLTFRDRSSGSFPDNFRMADNWIQSLMGDWD